MRPLAFILTFGCGSLAEPGTTERVVATIILSGDSTTISAPASVPVHTPANIEFITFAGGCIGKGETIATVEGLVAQVLAYQYIYHPKAGEACTADLRFDRNVASVRFDVSGTATIRIVGRKSPGGDQATLARAITVTP